MSDGGSQIFVDELTRFAAEAADVRCAVVADRLAAPLRVAVSGRRGVGRSTVEHALTCAADVRGTFAVTTSADADIEVYVIAEVVKPEDRAAITATGRPFVAVLNKADLIATTEPGLPSHGPTGAARIRGARLSAYAGLPIQPMAGLLAVAALDDLLADALWAELQAVAARPAQDPALVGRQLLDTVDVFGVEQAVASIRRGETRDQTRARLRRLSCIDEVIGTIESVGAQVHYHRLQDAVAELETLAVTDRRVGDFLARDDTVFARMAMAVDVVEAAGLKVDRCEDAAAYLRRAVGWQRYGRGPVAGLHRACGADIVRGSLRLWSKVGSSA